MRFAWPSAVRRYPTSRFARTRIVVGAHFPLGLAVPTLPKFGRLCKLRCLVCLAASRGGDRQNVVTLARLSQTRRSEAVCEGLRRAEGRSELCWRARFGPVSEGRETASDLLFWPFSGPFCTTCCSDRDAGRARVAHARTGWGVTPWRPACRPPRLSGQDRATVSGSIRGCAPACRRGPDGRGRRSVPHQGGHRRTDAAGRAGSREQGACRPARHQRSGGRR
ncbi:hypothetical protein KGG73_gp76 [Streptomyces phage Sentinel]|uniref:Uncharacterized protein n=1 Tax=Streptomyces phage Sentinel TaxID=2767584 RepID=A0A873WEP8_9CAUD|nr:hypothetical protein KGG73_gp76 [Streptomyces phage Sentinel]QPB09910.1 hypothetical protein CPT_Sentinel_076 [Streptomyces phage Sentinel]